MLGDLSFIILREIIKRIVDHESIDNLTKLNKKFKNLITNDRVCQERYVSVRYPNLKIILNTKNLKIFLKPKFYLELLESEIKENQNSALFIRPSDDSFIIYINFEYNDINITDFMTNDETIVNIAQEVKCESLQNIKNILFEKDFFLLNLNVTAYIINCLFANPDSQGIIFTKYFCENGKAIHLINKNFNQILSIIAKKIKIDNIKIDF